MTDEGVPVAITLGGYSPLGGPLTYEVLGEPLDGELSGTAPALTYTPDDNFEGLDGFSFLVSDTLNTSFPARVDIVVNTGAEAIPPEVFYTLPADEETGVPVPAVMIGDTYPPFAIAWISEPLDASTVSTDTVRLTDVWDQEVEGDVVLVPWANRIEFLPKQPLVPGGTYTATINTDVYDTSGNPLAADYVWSFRTEPFRVWLPLAAK